MILLMPFIKSRITKHYEILAYLFFGFLAVVFNLLSYWAISRLIGGTSPSAMQVLIANTIAFFATIIFAYFTNCLFVFRNSLSWKTFWKFFGMRIGTILIDNGGMWLFLITGIPDIAAKVIVNIVIIVLNYLFSKFLIFKR